MDAEKADVAKLNGLQQDLNSLRNVIQQEDIKVREEATAEARRQLERMHEQEEAIWGDAGKLLHELATVWNAYTERAEGSSKFAHENGLDGLGALAVVPAPLSFKSWLLLLHRAATDPEVRADPFEGQLVDIGAFGRRDEQGNDIGGAVYDVRPAGTRTVETRRKLDYGDRLFHLTPDLRSVLHALQLSGHVPTIASE